jgi:hypothetical protein
MYDLLAELFVISFAVFYFILFTAFIFWILKPALVRAVRKCIRKSSRAVKRQRALKHPLDVIYDSAIKQVTPAASEDHAAEMGSRGL